MKKQKNKLSLKEDIRMIIQGYKVLFSIDKRFITLQVISSVINSFSPFVNLFMSARIISELTGKRDLTTLLIYALITVSLNLLITVLQRIMSIQFTLYTDSWWTKFSLFFNDVNNNMQYEHLENPEVRILKERIYQNQNATGGGLARLYWGIGGICNNLFTIIFSVSLAVSMFFMYADGNYTGITAFVNSPYSVLIIVSIIFINTAVGMWCNASENKASYEAWSTLPKANRICRFFSRHIYGYESAMDTRLYNQSDMVIEAFNNWFANPLRNETIEKINFKFGVLRTFLDAFMGITINIFVGIKAYIGSFGIGSFVQYTGAVNRFVSSISNLISDIVNLRLNNIFLKDTLDYINLPNDMYQGTLPVEKRKDNEYEIEFRNVSFKYPSTDIYALRNLSMKVRIGQRLAVVGMNGSGKTTMIKLLCRLYDPTEGEILLNGIDIRKYRYNEYMNIFSVVFQDFSLFSFSLGQNIAASVEVDSEKAEHCIKMAGFDDRFKNMPKGLETALYKNFEEDGVEISGGEGQKIAIARALYKNAPFIVLDEPTAALDPIAEFEIYSKFNEIVGDKTAIYISHRLSSCRFCDDIAVFHEGELIQRGSHNSLISDENGKYYELWNAQAQYYMDLEQ